MQVENIIFLSAKFKSNNSNYFDLSKRTDLLHYLERKFTYVYAKSETFKDVVFLDFNKHYVNLLKTYLFNSINSIDVTPVGIRKGTDDVHENGALNNLNNLIFPTLQLYHYILLVSKRKNELPVSNTNYDEQIGLDFESGLFDEENKRISTEMIRLKLFQSLFANYGLTRGDLDTNWEFSAYDSSDHTNHISKHYEIDKAFASYLYNMILKENVSEFTSSNFHNIIDNFVKDRLQDLIDFIFLLDNYHMLPEWGKWRNVPSQFALGKTLGEYSYDNVANVNNKKVGDIELGQSLYSERRHYKIDSGPNSWYDDSENYIRHRNRVKTLVIVNAPMTLNMLNRSTKFPKKVQSYLIKLIEVDKNLDSDGKITTSPGIETALMNDNARNCESNYHRGGINYLSNFIDYYPFDFIIQYNQTGNVFAFDVFKNKIAKVINQLTYKSTLPNASDNAFINYRYSYKDPNLVFTSSSLDIKNLQYRFKNKAIFSINNIDELLLAKKDDSNTIDVWHNDYDLFQSGFDYDTFNYNTFIDNLLEINSKVDLLNDNSIGLYLNYQCIQKILKDDNIDHNVYENNVKQDLNDALELLSASIDYNYCVEVDEMYIDVQDIKNICDKDVAFKFFYDLRFELTDFMRVIGLVMREFNNPKIILESNTLESFNLSKLLITAIYKNMNRHCEIYCTYKESFKSTSFYELFSEEIVKQ